MFTVDNLIFYTMLGLVAFGAYFAVKRLAEGKKEN
jgi:hypothetical protein